MATKRAGLPKSVKLSDIKMLERFTVRCPMKDSQLTQDWLYKLGARLTRSGPKLLPGHRCDPKVFEAVVEILIED